MKYKHYFLSDLVTIKYGKNQKKVVSEYGNVPIYGTGGLMGYATDFLYDKPSVLIGRKGTISKVKYVEQPFWTVDTLFYTVINTDLVIPKYLYYVMIQLDLNNYNEGTTIPSLRRETLYNLEFDIPPIDEQKKIISCLKPLEEKIVNNNEINNNLEKQAQALYKSWFVDFELNSGVMPSDWKISQLASIAKISTKVFSPAKNPNVEVEHYSIPSYDEKHYPIFEISNGIKSNKYCLTSNSVMISKLNPNTKRLWRPYCISDNPICSTEFIVYEPINPLNRDYIYSIIDSIEFSTFLCSHTTGSTNSRQRTTPSITLTYDIVVPDEKTIHAFCSIVSPMYDLIENNTKENQKLAETRDKLLPKLMSGELDVSDIRL